jgi:hypothetical protein
MTFKTWLLSEILTNLNSNEIQFEKGSDGSVKYPFNFKGVTYSLSFNPTIYSALQIPAWELKFTGPKEYQPTGLGTPIEIYQRALSGVKAFIDKFKPKCLEIYGHTSSLTLIYEKFIKRFLADSPNKPSHQVFVQIDPRYYISKDTYNELDDDTKQYVDQKIAKWSPVKTKFYDKIRQARNSERQGVTNNTNTNLPRTWWEPGELNPHRQPLSATDFQALMGQSTTT